MAGSPFVDYVKIYFKSGRGGAGAVSWRREALVPKGGPDGGDGGAGGKVILEGDPQLWTLLDLKYRKHIHAPKGERGSGARKKGKQGADEILKVPLGTVAIDHESGEVIGEVKEEGEQLVLLNGGKGGLGNWHFRSSTRQAPTYAQPGEEGEEKEVVIELKVLADVGLVGLPNAGKSTLLSVVTAAKPKIGDYPFTTLVPNLGIVKHRAYQSFAIADIPGIIEGASEGKGLGLRFLRHIERNAVLLFMVPADSPDHRAEYEVLINELKAFNKELMIKSTILGISKIDLMDEELRAELQAELADLNPVFFSAATEEGIGKLKDHLWIEIEGARTI